MLEPSTFVTPPPHRKQPTPQAPSTLNPEVISVMILQAPQLCPSPAVEWVGACGRPQDIDQDSYMDTGGHLETGS
jgi:hypothetical protein